MKKQNTIDLWTAAKLSRVSKRDRRWVERRIANVTPLVLNGKGAHFSIDQILANLCADETSADEKEDAANRAAKLRAERESAEIDLAKKKGELVPADAARELWRDWLAKARVLVQSAPMPESERVKLVNELAKCAEGPE